MNIVTCDVCNRECEDQEMGMWVGREEPNWASHGIVHACRTCRTMIGERCRKLVAEAKANTHRLMSEYIAALGDARRV